MECYKKFTVINSNNKYNKVQTNEARETRVVCVAENLNYSRGR